MCSKINNADPISFADFMCNFHISIPLIQREYAQGRDNAEAEEIRIKFVPELIQVLSGTKDSLLLDFVFGVKQEDDFIPLDGQQRLTTLLLLHWYFGKVNDDWIFSYKSRRMANTFVEQLLSKKEYDRTCEPSSWIKRQNWFFPNWMTDPTVSGMLTMLDAIHNTSEHSDVSPEKVDSNIKNIKFYCSPIQLLDADHTYTKMNARGEPLTDWENLKALLDKKVKDLCIIDNPAKCEQKNCSLIQWTDSIDGNWLFKLEEYAELKADLSDDDTAENNLEKAIEKINLAFRNVFDLAVCIDLSQRAVHADEEKMEDHFLKIALFHDHEALLSDYCETVTWHTIELATRMFQALCNRKFIFERGWTKDRSRNYFWGDTESGDNDFTKQFLFSENYNYKNCLRFYAISLFENDKNIMRIILNLLDNTETFSRTNFADLVEGINTLARLGANSETLSALKSFSKRQIEEEIQKFNCSDLIEFEKHPLLYGSIGFLWDGSIFNKDFFEFFKKCFVCEIQRGEKKWEWVEDAFYELLKYYDGLTDAVYVPHKDEKKWRSLFKQDDARRAFAKMASQSDSAHTPLPWVSFFIQHRINDHKIMQHDSNIYDYKTDSYISGNAVRLTYNEHELKLLKYLVNPYLFFNQNEACLQLQTDIQYNANVSDEQKQASRIKLSDFYELQKQSPIQIPVYDDQDQTIGSLNLLI